MTRKMALGLVAVAALVAAGCDDDGATNEQGGADQGAIRDANPADASGAGGGAGGAGGGGPMDQGMAPEDAAPRWRTWPHPTLTWGRRWPTWRCRIPTPVIPRPRPWATSSAGASSASPSRPTLPQTGADLNNDNRADNSLSLAAALANDGLQGAVDDGSLNLLPTSIGLAAPGANGEFDLALLTGNAGGAGYVVSASSLDDMGNPRVIFGGTRIAAGR
ncbi:MAG: hypothetical protein R3F43_18325 [bacterium]